MHDDATTATPRLVLSTDEIIQITDGLTQPAAQLKALHRMGFTRAHRPRGGAVVLARAHYLAVEEGRAVQAPAEAGPAEQNAGVAPNVLALREWMNQRGRRGQKAQG